MNKPTRTLAILCAAAATAALGGTYSWNVTTGGALDAANWTPQGTPGSSDAVTLRYEQSDPYFLDEHSDLSVKAVKSMETSLLTTPSLVVKRSAHHIDGGRIVLIKANNTDIDMDAIRSHFTFTLPEGCTLDLSNAREIAIHVPSRRGTIISFK